MTDLAIAEPETIITCGTCGREVHAEGMANCAEHVSDDLGISYRQLDFWTRKGWLLPIPKRSRSGVSRSWPAEELKIARRMGRLVAAGLTPEAAHRFARESWPSGEIAAGIRLEAGDA